VHYCDGASFTGDREAPVSVEGTPVFYRGRRIRDAAIAFLLQNAGMSSADEIVVSGTSAGGLAVYLNIDQIAEQLPDGARVRGLASAGYFLAAGPAGGYQDQMLELAREQNATAALSPACRAAAAAEGRPAESCFFAEHAAAFIKTPTFALQSRFDTWQLAHIPHVATSNVSGVYAYGNLIRQRIQPLVDAAGPGRAAELPRHAVWLSPCETHGLACTAFWTDSRLNGTFSPAGAFQRWASGSMDTISRQWIGSELNQGC